MATLFQKILKNYDSIKSLHYYISFPVRDYWALWKFYQRLEIRVFSTGTINGVYTQTPQYNYRHRIILSDWRYRREEYIAYEVKKVGRDEWQYTPIREFWERVEYFSQKNRKIVALTGDTRSSQLVNLLRKHKIGRFYIKKAIRPYPGEKWGFDNGAYGDYLRGKEFDSDRYKKALEGALKIAENFHPPYLAVLPDIVKGGQKSLELSLNWLERELRHIPFSWYLAVQDGMDPEEVRHALLSYSQIEGLFLGGTDEFKKTAKMWSSLAHSLGRKFHYARAGSIKKVKEAIRAGADSLDSALPLWTKEKFRRFIKALTTPTQLELPLEFSS